MNINLKSCTVIPHLLEANTSHGVNLSWKKGDLGDLQDVCSSCNMLDPSYVEILFNYVPDP